MVDEETGKLVVNSEKKEAPAIALAAIVDAWNALPEGYYNLKTVEEWLKISMAPAIERARIVLDDNLKMGSPHENG